MQIKKESGKIHLVLDIGEEIISSLIQIAKNQQLPSASFTGIGVVGEIMLGFFDSQKKEYIKKEFPGNWELISLIGSISWDGDDPIVHAHVCLGGADYTSQAGHLFKGTVKVTGEIFINVNEIRLERRKDPNLGIKLLKMK